MFAVCYFYLTVQCVNGPMEYFSLDIPIPKQVFGISAVVSTELSSLRNTVSYCTPILGAYVADMYIGRFVLLGWMCSLLAHARM